MHVGQRVEFIGPGIFSWLPSHHTRPVPGGIYTIRDMYIDPWNGNAGLRLVEMRREVISQAGVTMEGGWLREEFRPIVSHKTDISIFQKMLKEDANVG